MVNPNRFLAIFLMMEERFRKDVLLAISKHDRILAHNDWVSKDGNCCPFVLAAYVAAGTLYGQPDYSITIPIARSTGLSVGVIHKGVKMWDRMSSHQRRIFQHLMVPRYLWYHYGIRLQPKRPKKAQDAPRPREVIELRPRNMLGRLRQLARILRLIA